MKRTALLLAVLLLALCACGEATAKDETTTAAIQTELPASTSPIQEPVILSVMQEIWDARGAFFADEPPQPQPLDTQGVDKGSVVSHEPQLGSREPLFGSATITIKKIGRDTVTVRFRTHGMVKPTPDGSFNMIYDWIAEIPYGEAYEITSQTLDVTPSLLYTFTKNFS